MTLRSYSGLSAALLLLALSSGSVFADEHSQAIQQNIDNLVSTNACAGCNLQGADLNRMILSGADLSNADLSGATFFLADLSGANLSGANLRDAKFGGADLANADLRGADLRGALLDGAFLHGSIMDGTVVEGQPVASDLPAEITEKVYVPAQTQPKQLADQKKAAVAADPAMPEAVAAESVSAEEISEQPQEQVVMDNKKTSMAADTDQLEANADDELGNRAEVSDQSELEEVMENKKAAAPVEGDKPEEPVAEISASAAPPVKTVAPVKQADIEEEGKDLNTSPEETEVVTDQPMDTVAAVTESEREELVETDLSKAAEDAADEVLPSELTPAAPTVPPSEQIIEKLLDTNRCYECSLVGVDLSGKDLSGADLEGSDLSGAILNKTDLAGTNLKGVSLRGAQLKNADLRKADLYKADLSDADLTDADFRGAQTDEANFSGALGYQPSLMVE
ncbi:MAG: pentapeptide repeat-containing protein [Desulfocapsaceae bacterium]